MSRRPRRRPATDWDLVFGLFWLLAILIIIPFMLWLRFAGPCEWMGWMPLSEIPNRCAEIKIR